jgi:hypothetical protein
MGEKTPLMPLLQKNATLAGETHTRRREQGILELFNY